MKKIILIPCVSKKLNQKSKAECLYISPLFKKNLQYAKSLHPDKIYILSAKHGLLKIDEEVEPYEKTLNKMNIDEIKKWSESVLDQLRKVSNLYDDKFIFLTGDNYRKFLLPHIKNYEIPMKGLSIGKQLKWLTENISNE
jgi:hypothetical protein